MLEQAATTELSSTAMGTRSSRPSTMKLAAMPRGRVSPPTTFSTNASRRDSSTGAVTAVESMSAPATRANSATTRRRSATDSR